MNLDGGIHEIPLPDVAGRLWLCGKHAIAPDPSALLDRVGAEHVVCLVERFELSNRFPEYVRWLESSDSATWFPIADLDFVSVDAICGLLHSVRDRLRSGQSIIAHCAAGRGRAGTLAVAVCLELGMTLDSALGHVRRHRPGAGPEVGAQMTFVESWDTMVNQRHS
jgi:protein-tyrosine phosphatase